jgi:hypothetical protein
MVCLCTAIAGFNAESSMRAGRQLHCNLCTAVHTQQAAIAKTLKAYHEPAAACSSKLSTLQHGSNDANIARRGVHTAARLAASSLSTPGCLPCMGTLLRSGRWLPAAAASHSAAAGAACTHCQHPAAGAVRAGRCVDRYPDVKHCRKKLYKAASCQQCCSQNQLCISLP